MNIQIFGTKKCNDTKKAERFFKERGIKYQFIDMKEKGMSKGELTSVAQANGGIENMINWEGKDQDTLALIKYIADEDKLEKILENPSVIKTPVVRNGKQSTLGYQPGVWKGIGYIERPIKEQNPSVEELKQWHQMSGLPLKKFFNTSGLLYKEMSLKDKLPTMSEEEQYALLAADGMLVKRPMVLGSDFVLVGFKEAEWEEKLSR